MYETIPGLGYVEAAAPMNPAMVEAAQRYNNSSVSFSLNPGAPYAIGSADFAKAVYGLQAQIFDTCQTPPADGPSDRLGASCANVDGKLGEGTAAAIRALPAATGSGDPRELIEFAGGGSMEPYTRQELGNIAATLGINAAPRPAPAPAPAPGPNGNGGVIVPIDPTPPTPPKKKAAEGNGKMFIIIGAAAVGLGVLWYMSKRKK